jgi:tRNA(fMet)-specific endonuclease VapC
MMILDTNTMSAIVAGTGPARLSRRLLAEIGHLFTTSINWAEVCYGLAKHPMGGRLRSCYEEQLLPLLQILDFDTECAEVYGELRAELERRGEPLPDADLMIAAIARRHDMTLVSGNTRHFAHIPGLKLENWLEE